MTSTFCNFVAASLSLPPSPRSLPLGAASDTSFLSQAEAVHVHNIDFQALPASAEHAVDEPMYVQTSLDGLSDNDIQLWGK